MKRYSYTISVPLFVAFTNIYLVTLILVCGCTKTITGPAGNANVHEFTDTASKWTDMGGHIYQTIINDPQITASIQATGAVNVYVWGVSNNWLALPYSDATQLWNYSTTTGQLTVAVYCPGRSISGNTLFKIVAIASN